MCHSRLETMVSEILTSIRSSAKQKVCHVFLSVCWLRIAIEQIESSFKDDGSALHIGLLSQRLLPRNALATMDHWVRFAFLVRDLVFSLSYSDAKYQQSAFRDFVNFTRLKKPAGALHPLRKRPNTTRNLVGLRSNELDALSATMSESQGAPTSGDDNDLDDNSTEDNPVTAITKKVYTSLQFWNYVDDYLEQIQTVFFADIQDSVERNRTITG